jgi:hypothetical protein
MGLRGRKLKAASSVRGDIFRRFGRGSTIRLPAKEPSTRVVPMVQAGASGATCAPRVRRCHNLWIGCMCPVFHPALLVHTRCSCYLHAWPCGPPNVMKTKWRAANLGRSRLLAGSGRLTGGCGQDCPPSSGECFRRCPTEQIPANGRPIVNRPAGCQPAPHRSRVLKK